MPSDVSSVRLSRMNRLMMLFYRYPRLTREDILRGIGYATGRTFERDAEFLRDEYGVEISYSRETRLYSLCSRGTFILNCPLRKREASGRRNLPDIADTLRPHLQETMEALRREL